MGKEDDGIQSFIGDLLADAVSKVLARHDIGSNGNDTSNSMCGGTASEGKIVVSSKPESSREREVSAGLNAQIREALTTEEPFSDEFPCDDATLEAMCLGAELRN